MAVRLSDDNINITERESIMKKLVYLSMVSLLLVSLFTGCNKSEESNLPEEQEEVVVETTSEKPETEDKVEEVVNQKDKDPSDNHYENFLFQNAYFEMDFQVPETWTVLSQEEVDALFGLGLEMMAEQVDEIEAGSDMDDYDLVGVFGAYKYPLDEARAFNPSMLINAEKNKALNIFLNGEDYLIATRDTLLETDFPFEFDDQISKIEYKDREYHQLLATLDTGTLIVNQSYFVTKINGYWVNITFSYTEEDGQEMIETYFTDL